MRRVIKVGTSVLRGDGARCTEQVIGDLAASLCSLWARQEPVALVTSGAVGLGCTALGQRQRLLNWRGCRQQQPWVRDG